MRVGLAAAGAVLAVLVAAVAFGPSILDWNRYRDSIAALASQQLGRPVHIGGAVNLALLPQPVLTAADILVEDAGDGVGLRARALRLRVALGGLLAGKIDARELVLQGADLHLPWPLPAGGWARRPPSWLTGLQARIEDGRLEVGTLAFTGLDGRIETDPDTGTLSAAGTGQSGERTWQFTARLGRPGRDGAAALDMSLDGQGPLRDTGGTFSGSLAPDGALAGRVAGRGPDLSLLMPAPPLPWRGDGRLSAQGGLAIADDLALEIGGAPARGAVAMRVTPSARLDLAIAAGRLDLDAWLPALLSRRNPGLRAGIPTGIDLSSEAATLAGGQLRQVRAAIDLGGGGMQVRDVSVLLPGDARLTLSGQVTGEAPHFDGSVRLAAPDLRATLRWLQRPLPWIASLPPGVLRTATLSGTVSADLGQIAVTDLRGTLDGDGIAGTASLRGGARPRVGLNLVLDRLEMDGWMPAEPIGPAAALSAVRSVDADVKLQAKAVSWGAVPLGAGALEAQVDASRVAVRRLDAQPYGTRLSAAGLIGEGGRLSDGRLDVTAAELAVLRPVAEAWRGAPPGLLRLLRGPGTLSVQAAGPPEALAGRVQAELADLRLDLRPTVNLPARRATGSVALHHPGASRLLEILGAGATAPWLGDGSLSLLGQVSAAPGRVEIESGTFSAGQLRLSGRLALEGRRLAGQLVADTLALPAPSVHAAEPLPLGWLRDWQAGLHIDAAEVLLGLAPVLRGAAADVALEDGALRLTKFSAQAGGGRLSGAATLDAAQEPPRLAVAGRLDGLMLAGRPFGTALDVAAGQVDASADLAASGFSPAALLATLGGRATVRVANGAATGFDLAAAAAAVAAPTAQDAMAGARQALLGGSTPFETLDLPASVAGGVAALDAVLAAPPAGTAPGGDARLTGTIDLGSGTVDWHLLLQPGPDLPQLGLRLAGPAAAPVRTPELATLTRWLATRPAPGSPSPASPAPTGSPAQNP